MGAGACALSVSSSHIVPPAGTGMGSNRFPAAVVQQLSTVRGTSGVGVGPALACARAPDIAAGGCHCIAPVARNLGCLAG